MLIYPAIDVIDGEAVRLYKGDYSQKESYGKSPIEFAKSFYKAGARHLHLVDLDGAKLGETSNFNVIADITAECSEMLVEVGGGIRNEERVEKYIEAGARRIILGTAALNSPDFVKEMVKKHSSKIAVGVDAKDGMVAVEGWLKVSEQSGFEFCKKMADIGVEYVIYTDIARDGAMMGANLQVYEKLAELKGLNITASGGVSSLEDIKALRDMGLYAAILGKALYKNAIKLEEAIAAAK